MKVRLKNQARLVDRKQATEVENKLGSHATQLIIKIFFALIARPSFPFVCMYTFSIVTKPLVHF